ncbi:photosystem II assembly protein Psb34 [Synechococcus sp. CCY 9618]|uniref:photosystem II assembly protein Psb34 n=1 Tax=Synechococcus sp. CCY 9618 TaxID=2815602 RepID=UPI001C2103C5|nr:ssl1498 family light-harvesting-like protein [Synechococcus sp. CCY 9618]
MQVTEEDGGKLNAFAKEPRMVLQEEGEISGSNRMLLIGGLVLVAALVAVAAVIS